VTIELFITGALIATRLFAVIVILRATIERATLGDVPSI
jgi:hypothetical protein